MYSLNVFIPKDLSTRVFGQAVSILLLHQPPDTIHEGRCLFRIKIFNDVTDVYFWYLGIKTGAS